MDQDVGGAIAHFFNCLVGPESVKPTSESTAVSSEKSDVKTSSVSANKLPLTAKIVM